MASGSALIRANGSRSRPSHWRRTSRPVLSCAKDRLCPQLTRDHELLDLVCSFANREDLGVPVEAAHRVLLDVAVSAMDLDGRVGHLDREPPALELCLRCREREVTSAVLEICRLVDEQP